MKKFCVLGTGMAGWGAAHHLREAGHTPILFDKKSHYGGHTASFLREGRFTFDEGPHVSFTSHERLQQLFAEQIDQQYETLHTKVNNYWRGHWVKHPAQINLYGLPPATMSEMLLDAYFQPGKLPASLSDYLKGLIGERLIVRPKSP